MYQKTLTRATPFGLQSYFSKIYTYMAGGLLMSGLWAWLSVREPLFNWFYKISEQGITYSVLGWISIFAPLGIIFLIGHAVNKLNIQMAKLCFWVFSALMGISLGNIFLMFSGAAIFQAFLVTAGMFLAISLYGFTTKHDLANLRTFLMMGLFGVVIAGVVNLFLKSDQFTFILNIIAVIVFVGLTAYDTNKLRQAYQETDTDTMIQAKSIYGALSLYLDFINLFRLMLYFLNNRR